jgi:hypothetical protein
MPRFNPGSSVMFNVKYEIKIGRIEIVMLTGDKVKKLSSLTSCSTVLLEKLTGSQLVKKFPAFYGKRRFITAFKSARHLSLS